MNCEVVVVGKREDRVSRVVWTGKLESGVATVRLLLAWDVEWEVYLLVSTKDGNFAVCVMNIYS